MSYVDTEVALLVEQLLWQVTTAEADTMRAITSPATSSSQSDPSDDDLSALLPAAATGCATADTHAHEYGQVADEEIDAGDSEDEIEIVCTQRQKPDAGSGIGAADVSAAGGGDVAPVTPSKSGAVSSGKSRFPSPAVMYQKDQDRDPAVEKENRVPTCSTASSSCFPAAAAAEQSVGSAIPVRVMSRGPGLSRNMPIRKPLHPYLYTEGHRQWLRDQEVVRKRQRKEERDRQQKLKRIRFMKYEYEPPEGFVVGSDGKIRQVDMRDDDDDDDEDDDQDLEVDDE